MMDRRTALGVIAAALMPQRVLAAASEPEMFADALKSGSLPPMADRLPKVPRVMDLVAMGREPGKYGGQLRMLIGSQKDIRYMTINGYSRLVGYDNELKLHADILESYEQEQDRVFTFRLRKGHKWSDGSPLTPEDFRYSLEDVWLNEDLSPVGPPTALVVDEKTPKFEILDPLTIRYSWDAPNPDFLPSLAAAQPLVIAQPSAYLKQFHKKYQTEDKLAELQKKYRAKRWSSLHIKMARAYRPENPDLPTLDPWRNTTEPPAEQFVFERNPYFHRVDPNGTQLPYIDRFILNVSSSAILPAKVGAGDSDLQGTGIDFADYTYLKEAEKRFPVKVQLWKRTIGSRFALLPNMNSADPDWGPLLRDVRVRRALSVAVNRDEINKVVFFGLGHISSDTVLQASPLFRPEYAKAWTQYDPALAADLLAQAGLKEIGDDGIRLLPDGRPAQIVVETAGEGTQETDVLELITDHWQKVGIALFIRTSQRDVFRSRGMAGQIMMSMWSGVDNGIPTADMNPKQFAPMTDDQLQWPVWGAHFLSRGQRGTAPDLPAAQTLLELAVRWRQTTDTEDRARLWASILALYADQVFSIGFVNTTPQPVLRSTYLQNFPKEAFFGFDPTAYFGTLSPDTFWLSDQEA
ncbi:ABC transporter substrate-binding protein [Mesorhizobium denitrificans]|uniref:ABC transporter substrate-binding protein n=1 Tax=Mesorhizobium denitrificans TaxID=2294114 RepID=A0A371X419_9HYPH|nr:ABC transporter substrate-binding protein [Mesorhizobium denitrificans]RFC63949.1 ABC transporter substrate-binding protein [Mesorhizobium denitrificans]